VEMVDERLTSWEAQRMLEEEGGRVMKPPARVFGRDSDKERRKPKTEGRMTVDAMAATVMLKEYLLR
jgi:RNase H-fold protein (predicted Holliday junction resolvase)